MSASLCRDSYHKRARVGNYTVDFWWTAEASEVIWDPGVPQRPLNAVELHQYRNARDLFLAEVGRDLALGPVVVIEC